jgi:hypothetical protein
VLATVDRAIVPGRWLNEGGAGVALLVVVTDAMVALRQARLALRAAAHVRYEQCGEGDDAAGAHGS